MIEQYLSTRQVCLLLSISLSSFYRYCKAGLLEPAFLTLGGHSRFSIQNHAQSIVCYSRVSSHDQKNDLLSQEAKLIQYAHNIPQFNPLNNNIISISDLGSGLNYKKKGLKNLLSLIFSNSVHTLVLNHKDRLLRFVSELIFYFCDLFKVKVIIEQVAEQSFEETLSADVIELMT